MTDPLETLGAELGARLAERGWTLVTAESCTGGWVAQVVTAIAGSSGWFDRGFVTYSNAAKEEMLGVSSETLATDGAVSEATAIEMARGAVARSHADVSVSITGVAGPAGGTSNKPVGMVCFGWSRRGGEARAATRRFSGDRASIRRQSVEFALRGVLELAAGEAT